VEGPWRPVAWNDVIRTKLIPAFRRWSGQTLATWRDESHQGCCACGLNCQEFVPTGQARWSREPKMTACAVDSRAVDSSVRRIAFPVGSRPGLFREDHVSGQVKGKS
jgi:hypothetical protein